MADSDLNSGYVLNQTAPWWEFSSMPRSQARLEFNEVVAARHQRINELKRLLSHSGITLDDDPELQRIIDWFVEMMSPIDHTNVLDETSLSVTQDIALLLGELAIDRHPGVCWDFFIWGKRNISYQSPVLMCFTGEEAKWHGNLDLFRVVHGYEVTVLENWRDGLIDLEIPPEHPLSGLMIEPPPLDPSEFLTLLSKVAARCQ